ncbi:putative baseplate assembly protein [filamentous cyanobacterium CCP3]|nr:putative baseplate assembly protein [filamentous cyanobacterium CCP3]
MGPIDIYLYRPLLRQGPTKLFSNLFPHQDSDYLALPLANEVNALGQTLTHVPQAVVNAQTIPHLVVVRAGQSMSNAANRLLNVSLAELQPNLVPNQAYQLTFQQTDTLNLAVSSTDISSLKQINEVRRVTATFLGEQREHRIIIGREITVEVENGSLFSTQLQNELIENVEDISEDHRIRISRTQDPTSFLIQEEAFSKGAAREMTLDGEYDKITPNSWVVIARSDREQPIKAQVKHVKTVSKAEYGITGKVSQLTLDRPWLFLGDRSLALLRETTVYAQSEPLAIADEVIDPLTYTIGGEDLESDGPFEIELDGLYDGLKPGRWLIVSGERTDIPGAEGVRASELVMLAGVRQGVAQVEIPADADPAIDGAADQPQLIDLPGDTPHSFLQLAQPLAYKYKRDTVTIHGNVVKATHGETRREVLGSGDGGKALQQFTLSKPPLTFLSAPTREGVESTLEVRVNDVKWHEVDNLAWAKDTDHSFITRTDDDDKTTVVFGDGVQGARLPSGSENVRALYRDGIGQVGNVKAEQVKLLATRPLGVKGVINPLPATGGANRETLLQAKRNAPMAVMALDRLVSVQDYADFVRTFAGIAKADAQALSNGRRELIHLTITGADNSPIEKNSDLYRNLWRSLRRFGDPYQPLQIDQRELMIVLISARVRILPQYLWETVKLAIEAALFEQFSFDRRDLGQDLLLSEVITTMHQVPGVDYVDVNILDSVSETEAENPETLSQKLLQLAEPALVEGDGEASVTPQPRPRIPVHLAQGGEGDGLTLRPAQLAILSPNLPETLKLEEIPR